MWTVKLNSSLYTKNQPEKSLTQKNCLFIPNLQLLCNTFLVNDAANLPNTFLGYNKPMRTLYRESYTELKGILFDYSIKCLESSSDLGLLCRYKMVPPRIRVKKAALFLEEYFAIVDLFWGETGVNKCDWMRTDWNSFTEDQIDTFQTHFLWVTH